MKTQYVQPGALREKLFDVLLPHLEENSQTMGQAIDAVTAAGMVLAVAVSTLPSRVRDEIAAATLRQMTAAANGLADAGGFKTLIAERRQRRAQPASQEATS